MRGRAYEYPTLVVHRKNLLDQVGVARIVELLPAKINPTDVVLHLPELYWKHAWEAHGYGLLGRQPGFLKGFSDTTFVVIQM
jgi:hypothetical protein